MCAAMPMAECARIERAGICEKSDRERCIFLPIFRVETGHPGFERTVRTCNGVSMIKGVLLDLAGLSCAGLGRAVLVQTGKYRAGNEARDAPYPTHL